MAPWRPSFGILYALEPSTEASATHYDGHDQTQTAHRPPDQTTGSDSPTGAAGGVELTEGQPCLVNTLAQEACVESEAGRDRDQPITAEAIHAAQAQIILRRETHLDQLTDKLLEERVRRGVEPLPSGVAAPIRRCVPTTCSTCATWGFPGKDPVELAL